MTHHADTYAPERYVDSNLTLEHAIHEATAEVRKVNQANGWYATDRRPAEGLALLHSEVSEWLEALRRWGTDDHTDTDYLCRDCGRDDRNGTHRALERTGHLSHEFDPVPPKPEGAGSEAADVFIRLLDECDRQGLDLAAEYRRKIAHNRQRHGGKSL